MIVRPIKTRKVVAGSGSLTQLLDEYLTELKEGSVVAITSKVAAICEGRVVPIGSIEKDELVKNEADYYLPSKLSRYGFSFTIAHNTLIPMAGIDESNGNGNYVLWPKDPQKTANDARRHLNKKFGLKKIGVVITDSTARPLHWGTEGVAVSYSGFSPTNNYVGQKDLFGRTFKVSKSNIADSLAVAAVLVMGEGTEQTPIAVVEDIPFVDFQDRDPLKEELESFYISHLDDDLFELFLNNMGWQEGERGK